MRMTRTTRTVLGAFPEDQATITTATTYSLLKRTGIKGDSLYPALERLELASEPHTAPEEPKTPQRFALGAPEGRPP